MIITRLGSNTEAGTDQHITTMATFTYAMAALAATVEASKDATTHAVLRFSGAKPLTEGRIDPIIAPGETSQHVHTVMGGSNMGISATGNTLIDSNCSNSLVSGDMSGYWGPKLYFRDPANGTLEDVNMDYVNAYYFFEASNDDIKAFPVGLMIHSGNAMQRKCENAGGRYQLNPNSDAPIQPSRWTCPRSTYDPPSWPTPEQSDGSTQGIGDPGNAQAGQGFPSANCDLYGSPLRMDVHFPSCYDPSKGLTDQFGNMVFPHPGDADTGGQFKLNCPDGFLHVPHLFLEVYWDTPAFADRWTPFQDKQPFVLANGDTTGCSAHADFLAAWDEGVLQHIIDTCNAGEEGMDHCDGVQIEHNPDGCMIQSPIDEVIHGALESLPGNNPIEGFT